MDWRGTPADRSHAYRIYAFLKDTRGHAILKDQIFTSTKLPVQFLKNEIKARAQHPRIKLWWIVDSTSGLCYFPNGNYCPKGSKDFYKQLLRSQGREVIK